MTIEFTSSIALPVFVWESGDLSAFATIDDLLLALEPVDVENGIYEAYDADGRLLRLSATGVERKMWGLVVDQSRAAVAVAPSEEAAGHVEELRRILRAHLRKGGALGQDIDNMALWELVNTAFQSARVHVRRGWLHRHRHR